MTVKTQLELLLIESGLSESCAILYLELLDKPAETIFELVMRTRMSKSCVYRAFTALKEKKMIANENGIFKANSLRTLVADLKTSQRNLGKLAYKIKNIAPFLKTPKEAIETFDQFYTRDQISEAYLFMSDIDYDISLDIGDFENFVPVLGTMETVMKFRKNRLKHATAHAVCNTFGPYTALFCTRESKSKWKNTVDRTDANFNKKFLAFSDKSDFVLFNDFSDYENPHSVLVKSKTIADFQRAQFKHLSQSYGN